MKEKVLYLLSQKEKLNEDISKLEECHTQILHQIEYSSKPKLITRSENIVTYIRNISNQVSSQNCSLEPISIEFNSDFLPEYLRGEFEIKEYVQIIDDKETIYSDPLTSFGITWRLKVYPNGNGQAKGNYLSVFLEMVKGYNSSAKYDYKIEMINHVNPDNSVSREYTSEFEVGECWGYNRFYRTESIINEGFVDSEGTLKLKFFVRASSYAQHSSDQSRYIDQLESKILNLKSVILDNNLKIPEEENEEHKEENEKDEAEDDELDKLPMNESNLNKGDTSDEEGEYRLQHIVFTLNLYLFPVFSNSEFYCYPKLSVTYQ